jgi:hypothetical protein
LEQLPKNIEVMLLVASDRMRIREPKEATFRPETVEQIRRRLARLSPEGGQDNIPALEAAWDAASAVENGAVLWVHGVEPVLLSSEGGMRQRLEHNTTRTRLFEVQTETGPDRLIEKLDGFSSLQHVPRLGALKTDLLRVFGHWNGAVPSFDLKRALVSGEQTGPQASRHLERLWARDEAARLAAARKLDQAAQLAVKNQLVTPLTGAVVLERKEQYDRHGLTPADPGTVPSVPEPTVLSLLGIGALALAMAKRRARR